MLGYPVASWYEPQFLASHIHADDLSWVLAAYQKTNPSYGTLRSHFSHAGEVMAAWFGCRTWSVSALKVKEPPKSTVS